MTFLRAYCSHIYTVLIIIINGADSRGERAVLKMGLYWGAKRGGDTLMASKWSILMESGCFFSTAHWKMLTIKLIFNGKSFGFSCLILHTSDNKYPNVFFSN